MTPPTVLFITYYRLVPTGMIGIFKRCVRLMAHLLEDFDLHLVNYGPLPDDDGAFAPIRPYLHIHDLPERSLGDELWDLCGQIRPIAVVLGETPLRGNMRLSHRVANNRGLWQIALENYYPVPDIEFVIRQIEKVQRWVFLGLEADGRAGRRTERYEVVPPLVKVPPESTAGERDRDRVCLIGYDKQTLVSGIDLLSRLPAHVGADVFTVPEWQAVLDARRAELAERRAEIHLLPEDGEIYRSMARSKVVFGKAGFQQVVESLYLGARVICRHSGGGLERELVPDHLQPHVGFLKSDDGLEEVVCQVRGWLRDPEVDSWRSLATRIPDAAAYGAGRLKALIEQAPRH